MSKLICKHTVHRERLSDWCKHSSDTHVHLCVSMPGEQSAVIGLRVLNLNRPISSSLCVIRKSLLRYKHSVGPTEKPVTVWARPHVSAALKLSQSREQLTLWGCRRRPRLHRVLHCLYEARLLTERSHSCIYVYMYVWLWKRESVCVRLSSTLKTLHWI